MLRKLTCFAKRNIIDSKYHTQRSFILYHVLNVRKKKEKNGKNSSDKKKSREILNINRNKKSCLIKLELKWNKLRNFKVINGNLPLHQHRVHVLPQQVQVAIVVVTIVTWKKRLILKLRSKLVVT
jgi:hypothetical protein